MSPRLTLENADAPRDWVIRKGGYFYRPDRSGYTSHIYEAGRYTDLKARMESMVPL